MNIRLWMATAILSLVAGFAAPTTAKDMDIGTFSANVGLFSDYAFRGVSQTDEKPALQGGMDWAHDSGFYAGMWGSNVNFSDGNEAQVEVDVYGGYGGNMGKFSYDLNFLYYLYPGASDSLDYDFWEITPKIGYDFGVASVTASASFATDYFAGSGDAQYYNAGIDVPLPKGFSLSGNVGHQLVENNTAFALPDYWTWGVGIGYDLGAIDKKLGNFSVGVNYTDTDISNTECGSEACEARAIFSLSASF